MVLKEKKKVVLVSPKRNVDGEANNSSKKLPSILKTVYGLYREFCHQTTLHGLKHTVADELHCTERLFWLLVTIAAFSGAVYCSLNQFTRYNSEPVVVSMQRGYRAWWSTFPAVTACFLERVLPEKASELIYSIWNVTEESDQEMYQYYYNFIELVADVSFRTNLQNFWKYQADSSVAGVDLVQLASNVHPTLSLKVIVSKADKEVQWVPVMTEMGICMTFNSAFAEFQNLLQDVDWIKEELLKCHYHSGQCFVRIDSVQTAVRYFIHSPYDIPSAISNPTGEVMPAEELVMEFKLLEIQGSQGLRNLRPEQRKCRFPDEIISEEIQSYSFSLCQMQCRTKMAIMFCGCRPYFYVKGVLPTSFELGLLTAAGWWVTKLRKADSSSIFGPEPGSKEYIQNPEKLVQCIAHRGASLDAPENTLAAFKYCVEHECYFVELDVRVSRDGKLIVVHDLGMERLVAGSSITDVTKVDWNELKCIDVGSTHPNKNQFKEVNLCLLDDALDYLIANKCKVIIDIKGYGKDLFNAILNTFKRRPKLYETAAVTCFNPILLYLIRRRDPKIVGALSYRPYVFSHVDFDTENGPTNPRFADRPHLHWAARFGETVHSLVWRWTAAWCGVSALLLHKEIASAAEVAYWRKQGVHCIGWSVNSPLEKLYWRGILKAPYLASTLVGEPDKNHSRAVRSRLSAPKQDAKSIA